MKTKKSRLVFLALIIIAIIVCLLLTVCGKQISIVGTWTIATAPYDYDFFYPSKIYFYEGGTGALEFKRDTYEIEWSIYDKTNLSILVKSTLEFEGGVVEYYIAVLDVATLNLVNKEQPTDMRPSYGVYYQR